jgi:N-acetylneuraminic acid mutarotase
MKIQLRLFLVFYFVSCTLLAQWSQKTSLPGIARAKAAAFTIGAKIYMVGGVNNFGNVLGDFWEYDIPSDTWTQKTDFPGGPRYGAASFVLNNKGYVATGGADGPFFDDLWEYNPATDSWIQRTGLPAGSAQHENQRREAYAFVIGNRAYLGGGDGFVFGANSTNNIAFYDLWEYNPTGNSWTQKADLPDFTGHDLGIAASINGRGYVGLGCDVGQTTARQGFWQYDPGSDTWIQKASYPSSFSTDAGAFVLDSTLYVVGGVRLSPSVSVTSQVRKYDPVTDTWSLATNFTGGAIVGEFVVCDGTTAFAGTGYNSSITARSDLWSYPATPTGIKTNNANVEAVAVFPNPASTSISIQSAKEVSTIEVYDAIGNKVLTEHTLFHNLSIQKLATGVYSINVACTDGTLTCLRLVKQD